MHRMYKIIKKYVRKKRTENLQRMCDYVQKFAVSIFLFTN